MFSSRVRSARPQLGAREDIALPSPIVYVRRYADRRSGDLKRDALEYHEKPQPGKISVTPPSICEPARFALAYSKGVAAACEAIHADPRPRRGTRREPTGRSS